MFTVLDNASQVNLKNLELYHLVSKYRHKRALLKPDEKLNKIFKLELITICKTCLEGHDLALR